MESTSDERVVPAEIFEDRELLRSKMAVNPRCALDSVGATWSRDSADAVVPGEARKDARTSNKNPVGSARAGTLQRYLCAARLANVVT